MSTQCRHFVQNAWKKELCSNCFKSREEHAANQESHRQIVTRTANSVKRVAHKVQGILRLKEASPPNQVRSKRKNVAFPESLTEIIGYDGGDDLGSDYEYDDPNQPDDPDSGCGDDDGLEVSLGSDVDDLPDSEEERALGNLTRANTNFNTVTANLTGAVQPNDVKSFASLMLGRAPKDGDTKKKPLLVTVTPFGGDDSVPTARRPSDKKSPEQTKPKPAAEPTSKPAPEPVIKKPLDEPKPCQQPPTTKTIPNSNNSNLGKIVDMPLITSTNLLSVIETKSTSSTEQKQRATSIARTPAIKKPENEKPRIAVAQPNVDQNTARNHKNLEMSNGVELNLSPIRVGEEIVRETTTFGKEIPSYKSTDYPRKTTGIADLTERKVEGEAATDKYPFEESRESAGEPDGKADEEVIAEPPALPKSPPPIESSSSTFALEKQQQQRHSTLAEPRTSFLHGITETKTIGKPVIPQKPVTLPTKAVGASLASLLSENRAYEFRLSQAARNNNLVHSQSETQLCEEVVTKRNAGQESQSGKAVAESCSEIFKASVAKVGDKDDTTEEDEDEDDSEASSTDQPRSNVNKRRMAPQPPSSTVSAEDSSTTMFARNPAPTPVKSDCPVVREKEKRERASSCSPKFRKSGVCDAPDPSHQVVTGRPPEPAPRRNISLSQDSLAMAAGSERIVEEKKKSRSKFSLKKLLRMGTRKDVDMTGGSSGSRNDEIPSTPQPKPRLEIIHPLELDGAAVQVLRNDKISGEDTTDSKTEPQGNTNSQPVHGAQHVTTRPSKPPPPPRSQSLDESSRPTSRASVPKQPQQSSPTSSSNGKPLTGKSWQPSGGSGSSASDSIYANLVAAAAASASGHAAAEDVAGAMRSGLAPAKPRRTSSMRDQANNNNNNNNNGNPTTGTPGLVPSRIGAAASGTGNGVGLQRQPGVERQRPVIADLQERLAKASSDRRSCSPELNDSSASLELRQGYGGSNHPVTKRQSDSGALESNSSEMKFQQALFIRSTSLPYCASEAESEMYSPFGYYYGDESAEDGQERKKEEETRIGRLRQRRGRSIVHRSLEDNYGAVIVANHEALAQFLEQTNQPSPIPVGLRSLKTASNLQFGDFSIDRSSAVSTGRRVFFSAVWNEQNVTLCLAFDPSMHASRKEFYLVPIVEFIDAVPKDVSDLGRLNGKKSSEATISVLPRLQVNTLKSFAELISSSESGGMDENSIRESSFILLQLVSALKSLQARGVEEAPGNLANVVLCREDKDAYHRLYMFQGLNIENCENNGEEYASLCQCAQNGLKELNLAEKLPLIQELLMREKAVTLSQVKSVLEFSLWGPSDATLGGPREREQALQRWLDLERATVLHALVRARAQLTVTDEYQLLFLVRTSAKIMCEASLLLDRQRSGLLMRSN
ncbi:inner centromere protein A isoform X2 [Nasonia vitripennis]|uniref:Serine-rich adhesin for platelets n=1 Tax=Nasonia vitripennis TaxID=7425 RepID=A0A7M7QGE3_NASVI|nr:inner centromere protein A isoform X2 [Nasonia vitripennis]